MEAQAAQSLRLDLLPLELLERIIIFTSFRTVHKLTQVNRTLHAACERKVVFRGLIDDRNGHGGAVWKLAHLISSDDLDTWKSYARADDELADVTRFERARLYPDLFAVKHPIVHEMEMPRPGDLLHVLYGEHLHAFCLAAASLSGSVGSQDLSEMERRLAEYRGMFLRDFSDDVQELGFEDFSSLCIGPVWPRSVWAYFALHLFYPILRHQLRKGMPTGTWDGLSRSERTAYTSPIPPFVQEIPFHEFMDLPLPFRRESSQFESCHLPTMVSKTFAEDGDWIGCYTIESEWPQYNMEWDPPVHSIRLRMGETDPGNGLLYYTGEGKDAVGVFYLRGAVNAKTGMTAMVKSYGSFGGPTWNNIGIITPFGILTSWGDQNWGGWALIWKTSWCSKEDPTAEGSDADAKPSETVA